MIRDSVLCGILVGSIVLLVSAPATAQCTKDTDCKGSRICVKGACAAPPQALPQPPPATPATTPPPPPPAARAPQCYRDQDCKGIRVCNNGLCMDSYATGMRRGPPKVRGRGALVSGIVLLSLGAVHATVGFVILGLSEGDDDAAPAFVSNLVLGASLMITGTILIPVGVHKIRKSREEGAAARSAGTHLSMVDGPAGPSLTSREEIPSLGSGPHVSPVIGPTRQGGMMFGLGGAF